MSSTADQYANDPIVCITFNDDVNAESLAQAYLDSVEAAVRHYALVYRIFDFRFATTAYANIYNELLTFLQGVVTVPPTIQAVFVGQPDMANFFAGQQVAFFEDVDSAIAHVQAMTAEPVNA